jgi:hypothetical protein
MTTGATTGNPPERKDQSGPPGVSLVGEGDRNVEPAG